MEYSFQDIEPRWQKYWAANKTYRATEDPNRPKFYVLDMFPYPSGAGLHVGHPLGYIASDIYARYMRHRGFNVLHPMGYDAYGLPAEQYAIQTGTQPADTTAKNIARYRKQLDRIGFSFDWDREVQTSDPAYYKWTQWTFIQLFNSWYDILADKAISIDKLVEQFHQSGNAGVDAATSCEEIFSAEDWNGMDEKQQQQMLMHYRLAYLSDTWVNWCPELGTVLANDEVKDGYSERGGYPVERKRMMQWSLRITAYAQRLLDGLANIEWTDSIKEVQRNWIGRSEGASAFFGIKNHPEKIEVFTTRPDTLFGASFMVLAPEHELVGKITTPAFKEEVEAYVLRARNRSERDRMTEVKTITGAFTGAYGINPLSGEEIPVWIADYVLAGYGTGAIMAVPGHDSRDFAFARHFGLPIRQVVVAPGDVAGSTDQWEESYDSKDGVMINSDFLNAMQVKEAIRSAINALESKGMGKREINYRLRDAIFSRQRYWGEPFPVYYKDGMPYMLPEDELPLTLPSIDKYLPTETGDPPLARAKDWHTKEGYPLETNTMPGFAGSSAYYLRYMDPHNTDRLISKEANAYWKSVDLYIGGDEHATGHLLYARFWNKFLFDLGLVIEDEPFKKLINQGKIQGRSSFVYRISGTNEFVSYNLRKEYQTQALHVDVNLVRIDELDIAAFRAWRPEYADATFILEDGKYICGHEVEKMSKSKHNVQSPDDLIERYGADTLRLYEMFLGPLTDHKPWDTNGIEGVFRFMRKYWRLFHNESGFALSDEKATEAELKVLHKTIKKVREDIERLAFNTVVSTYMICVNELAELKCNKREILEPLNILLSPFAPHIAEEIWQKLGHTESITTIPFPEFDERFLREASFEYPVSFNGKMRFKLELPVDMPLAEIEKSVMQADAAQKWLEGVQVRKVIIVPKKIINVVVG